MSEALPFGEPLELETADADDRSVEWFEGRYVAKAPISHGADTSTGIVQRLRTLQVEVTDPRTGEEYVEDVPVVSGNSLRGQLRDRLAKDFCELLAEEGDTIELHDPLFNVLWSGGSLQRDAGPGTLKRRLVENVREYVPPLSLLGGAVGTELFDGRLDVMGQLWPICMETRSFTGVDSEETAYGTYVDSTYYTRSDDREGGRDPDEEVQQMRYRVHVLVPGTEFHHRMALAGATAIERACLGRAFELFSQNPAIGGMSSRGHGTVAFEYDPGLPDPEPYLEYVRDNRDEIREFVDDLDERLM